MSLLTDYINRARYIIKNEGPIRCLKRSCNFLSSCIFFCEEYYVRQHFTGELVEADFQPKVSGFIYKTVTSNEIADDWAKQTGFDFRDYILNARRLLDAGAVAFCIFTNDELAHITWAGFDQKSKDILNPQPYKVDFTNHEACSGGAETVSKYRGSGLMAYACFHRNEYMKQRGIKKFIGIDATDNIAIYKVQSRFPTKISARARYIKFLRWKFWKETSLPDSFIPPFIKSDIDMSNVF